VIYVKNNVKEMRNRRCMSQTALAEATGTTKRTIYAIEKGNHDIRISLAQKLASSLGCGVDDLFVYDNNAPTTTDKALWFTNVVRYTSEELDKPIDETTMLLNRSGLAQRIITGYGVWHTQGYEYMAEVLADELSKVNV
jgi:putative transcriptional regulator